MSTLNREELLEACRDIYAMAGDDLMLPPLLRDTKNLGAKSRHTYYSLIEAGCVRFIVEFDRAYVEENKFPLSRLPLRFKCELSDVDFKEAPVELSKAESQALIRAFFLGAKTPIIAEPNPFGAGIKLCIQLSSSFFVECGELVDLQGDLTSKGICARVSQCLYDRSRSFFASREDGLEVWSARVAQELFNETKPSPEFYWPDNSQQAFTVTKHQMACPINAGGHVVAGAPIVVGATALATVPMFRMAPFANATLFAPLVARAAPRAQPRLAPFGAAAIMAIAAGGFLGGGAALDKAPAPTASEVVEAKAAPAGGLPTITAPAEQAVLVAFPELGSPQESAPEAVRVALAEVPPPREIASHAVLTGVSDGASKTVARAHRTGRSKTVVRRTQRGQPNPFVAIGRAATKLASGVVDNLRQIPVHLSAMVSER